MLLPWRDLAVYMHNHLSVGPYNIGKKYQPQALDKYGTTITTMHGSFLV